MRGIVRPRLPGKDNPKLATGAVEVLGLELVILNRCPTPPFEITEFPGEELANEDLRLQYRYLDLRRSSLQRTLILRHRLNKVIRDHLDSLGFLELETPLLGRSSPEGPAIIWCLVAFILGAWYALPQSPQLYKQLLMVAGLRQILPDRPLSPRRGPAGRPSAGIHAARPRNVLRRAGRHSERHRDVDRRCLPEVPGRRDQAAVATLQLRRGHAALRQRQA